MIDARARTVLDRLEARDALERETGAPRDIRLRQIKRDVGIFLHNLVLASRPRALLEIGSSGGYSAVWTASAARAAGGALTTLEIDPVKVALARETLRDAGLEDVVTIVAGDAFDYLRAHPGPFDFVFLDAEKEDYLAFLSLIVPLLATGGVLVADNLISHEAELGEFRDTALGDPRLSAVVVPIGRGELFAVRLEDGPAPS
jgi:predicted O-methyltransferase YrrM